MDPGTLDTSVVHDRFEFVDPLVELGNVQSAIRHAGSPLVEHDLPAESGIVVEQATKDGRLPGQLDVLGCGRDRADGDRAVAVDHVRDRRAVGVGEPDLRDRMSGTGSEVSSEQCVHSLPVELRRGVVVPLAVGRGITVHRVGDEVEGVGDAGILQRLLEDRHRSGGAVGSLSGQPRYTSALTASRPRWGESSVSRISQAKWMPATAATRSGIARANEITRPPLMQKPTAPIFPPSAAAGSSAATASRASQSLMMLVLSLIHI